MPLFARASIGVPGAIIEHPLRALVGALLVTVTILVAGAGVQHLAGGPPSEIPAAAATSEALPSRPEPAARPAQTEPPTSAVAAYGVSAGHPAAVDAGMGVLAAGGNAVDAAIAAAYAVGVAEPYGSGIGGGGAALVTELGGEPIAFDYRDVVDRSGVVPASGVGIPGFVAGMAALHAAHGTIPMANLIAPAIAIAEDGVPAYPMLADQLRFAAGRLPVDRLPHLYPGGRPLEVGEPMVQTELAETLRNIVAEGADAFYGGRIAAHLAEHVDGIDLGSLGDYEVVRREPVRGAFAGYEVVSAPPPLAGTSLVQMLQVAEALGAGDHVPGSPSFTHALAAGWRIADHHRSTSMADPAFVEVVTDELTDAASNAIVAAAVPATGLVDVGAGAPADTGGETTHLTVVDRDGTMVSMTNTLTNIWGAGDYELGFFLNDQLSNFGSRAANEPPQPGKRAVSSTAPTIVLDAEGRPVLGLGSPGGGRIPLAIAQVLSRWALHGEGIAEAVAAPRFHLAGSTLYVEDELLGTRDTLVGLGYRDVTGPPFAYYHGSVQAIEVDYAAGELRGAADPRREAAWRIEPAQ